MIKAKQVFFWTSNLKGHGFHWDKATILYLTLKYYSLSVLSEKLHFLEIGPVNQNLWPFKCMMLKTLNSNFSTEKTPIVFGQNGETCIILYSIEIGWLTLFSLTLGNSNWTNKWNVNKSEGKKYLDFAVLHSLGIAKWLRRQFQL